jgi:hypothetical protein
VATSPWQGPGRPLAASRSLRWTRGTLRDAPVTKGWLLPVMAWACVAITPSAYRWIPGAMCVLVFALLLPRNPVRLLALTALLLFVPLYLRVGGRDSGVLTTFLILGMYAVALAQGRLARIRAPGYAVIGIVGVYAFHVFVDFGSVYFETGLRFVIGLAAAAMLGHMIVSFVKTGSHVRMVLGCFAVALSIQAVLAILSAIGVGSLPTYLSAFAPRGGVVGQEVAGGLVRATGTIGNYELLAEWLAAGFAAFLVMAMASQRHRGFWLLACGLCAGGTVATLTRGGVVAAVVAAAVVLLAGGLFVPHMSVRLSLVGAPLAIALMIGFVFLFPALTSEMAGRFAESQAASSRGWTAAINRDFWSSLPEGALSPTMAGHGVDREVRAGTTALGALHSLWLSAWVQAGVLGVLLIGFLVVVAYMRLLSSLPVLTARPEEAPLVVALLGALVAVTISEFKVETIRLPFTMQATAVLLALILVSTNIVHARRLVHRSMKGTM